MTSNMVVWLGIGAVVIAVWLVKVITEGLTKPRPKSATRSAPRPPVPAADLQERRRVEEESRRRRDDARLRCELFYALHAPEIAARFTREQFTQYLRDFLGDHVAPELVEERADRLQEIIREHAERTNPKPKLHDIAALAGWYVAKKAEIEAAGLSDEDRGTALAVLEQRYGNLVVELMREAQP